MPQPTDSLVRVKLGDRAYDIEIGRGNLAGVAAFLKARRDVAHAVVVTDANVDPLHGDRAADLLTEEQIEAHVLVIDAGEGSKAPEVAHDLWETMLEEGVDRGSVVLAVGGGVVGDLAGFVAATFARGLDFFQTPTTLLAQVDSSVGGKVGVNLPGGKNMVGAFWQPRGVLIDIDTLGTLPDRDYRAGLAEVVKYGVILDADFFAYLENQADAINARDPGVLQHIVARSCRLKAEVVEADEREESGLRAILNYGHTFCHAIEAATGYARVLHGEGVAMGMLCASRLGEQVGIFDSQSTDRQRSLLSKLKLPTTVPPDLNAEELYQLMWRDKKVKDGRIRFVLPSRIGHVELVDSAKPEQVLAAIHG
ncbi:MAG: 3-dehydroquinate synthase [Planctomycetota bacterium]